MKMFFRSIQKWMRVRKVRRELKKDQALRERCIGYVTKVNGTSSFIHVADYTYKYIKEHCIGDVNIFTIREIN